jgi:hypothetical protein
MAHTRRFVGAETGVARAGITLAMGIVTGHL